MNPEVSIPIITNQSALEELRSRGLVTDDDLAEATCKQCGNKGVYRMQTAYDAMERFTDSTYIYICQDCAPKVQDSMTILISKDVLDDLMVAYESLPEEDKEKFVTSITRRLSGQHVDIEDTVAEDHPLLVMVCETLREAMDFSAQRVAKNDLGRLTTESVMWKVDQMRQKGRYRSMLIFFTTVFHAPGPVSKAAIAMAMSEFLIKERGMSLQEAVLHVMELDKEEQK